MLSIRFSLMVTTLALWGCGRNLSPHGKPTALTIVASFPESEASDEQLSLTYASPSVGVGTPTPTATSTATPAATPAATSTATSTDVDVPVARETSNSTATPIASPLSRLSEDLAGAEKIFTHKSAFRWFSYSISNADAELKSDSIEINDPAVSELSPIEVTARVGDKQRLKLSFMQVDFQSEADAKNFCDTGSIGFVRTWDTSAEKVVDDTGVISLNFEESGRTAVTMAAIRVSQDQLQTKTPETLKSTLVNEHTGFRLAEGVCPIKNLYPNFKSTDRFLKVMTFSHPLKPMQLLHFNDDQKLLSLTEAGGWKAFLKGIDQPDTKRELGVSAAFKVDNTDSNWNLVPALFTDVLPPELSPRLPVLYKKTATEHATRLAIKGNHLRFDARGALAEKVKVELLTLTDASTACNAGNPIATYADHTAHAIDIQALLGQGAGTYMLRIRSTFADKTQVCSTSPLKIDVPAFIPDAGENKIASGENHTCAISGGKLYCWGYNSVRQVTGTASSTDPVLIPTLVAGLGTKAHAVFAGPNHTCAIVDVSGTKQSIAKCWGGNFPHSESDPFYNLSTSAPHTIATSSSYTCAVPKTTSTASSISCVSHPPIGESPVVEKLPLPFSSIPANTVTSQFQIAISDQNICIYNDQETSIISGPAGSLVKQPICISPESSLTTSINITVNDPNQFRMVSDGTRFYGLLEGKALFWSIDSMITSAEPYALPEPIQGATSIYASNGNVCAVKDGMPICWGNNSDGQFIKTAGTAIPSEEAQMIPGVIKPSQLSLGGGHVCATDGASGNLRCLGRNENGQLGINRTKISEEPTMTIFNVVAP